MTDTLATQTEPKAGRGTWRLSWRGLRLITELELKQRVRSTKWKWALATFGAIVGVVTLLLSGAMSSVFGMGGGGSDNTSDVLFGVVVFFVLGLGLLVSPTLSATSINGDSKEGTLAPLQATALSSIDIVVGKLIGAWVASLAFLVVALPFIIFSYFLSNAPAFAMLTTVIVLAIELLTATQALEFRRPLKSSPQIEQVVSAFREKVSFIAEDRVLHHDMISAVTFLREYPLGKR